MPDSQGYPTKQEILEALKGLKGPGPADDPVESGRISKVVACAGIVKIWLAKDWSPEDVVALKAFVADIPGVKALTLAE